MLGFPEDESVVVNQQGDTISYLGGPAVLERAQRYGDRFEQTDDPLEAGKIAAEYMAEAHPQEWPLAPWLFDAIAISKGSAPDTAERDALDAMVAQFRKISPGAQWFNKLHRDGRLPYLRQKPAQQKLAETTREDRLRSAVHLASQAWLREDCKRARDQAEFYKACGERDCDFGLDRLVQNVRHRTADLHGAGNRPERLYERMRTLVREGVLDWDECERFLLSLPGRKPPGKRPARLAATFAALVMKVPIREIERRTRST